MLDFRALNQLRDGRWCHAFLDRAINHIPALLARNRKIAAANRAHWLNPVLIALPMGVLL